MAHLLIVTRGLPSLVYPAIELARRLAAAGHRVTFAGEDSARALASGHGLDFLALEADQHEAFLRKDRRSTAMARWSERRVRQARARAALAIDGFANALRRDRPDLVLINGEMHAHILTAAALGVPLALLNSFVSIWRAPRLPPPHHTARPGSGWKGTAIGMSALWLNLRLRKIGRRWRDHLRDAGCDRVSTLRRLAREVGLEQELDTGSWLIPFTYRRYAALSLHALEFEFPHRPPPHVHYVGPMILRSRQDQALSGADRLRLEALLTGRADRSRTLIYAGFGSVLSTDLAFLRRLTRIVQHRPSWDLVLSLSGRISADALGPVPARVHVFPWVPQVEVLARADLAICHGGISTIDECVASGVPVLVYCGGETDMAGTTSRVVYHGLGIAGDRRRDTAPVICARVDRLLTESGYRSRVRRFQRTYAAYVENRVAERAVKRLLTSTGSRGQEQR